MEINLDEIKSEVVDLLQEEAKDLWEGSEDADFLKDVGGDIAQLRFDYLRATSQEAKDAIREELDIAQETINQKLQAKRNLLNRKGQEILPKILGVLVKVAIRLI